MKRYRIADLIISVDGHGQALKDKMKIYETNERYHSDISISPDPEKMKLPKKIYPEFTPDEWEYLFTGFAFAHGLLDYDGFCLHSSAVALENRAVLFSGPCGAGKSTHAALWRQYFGDKAVIINDDKPALRKTADEFYVYGTPWSGKEDLHMNRKVSLAAIVFLEQAPVNKIWRLDKKEALKMMLYQSLRPSNSLVRMDKLLILLDDLLKRTDIYKLKCNVTSEAVELAYNTAYAGE